MEKLVKEDEGKTPWRNITLEIEQKFVITNESLVRRCRDFVTVQIDQ